MDAVLDVATTRDVCVLGWALELLASRPGPGAAQADGLLHRLVNFPTTQAFFASLVPNQREIVAEALRVYRYQPALDVSDISVAEGLLNTVA